MNDKNYPYDDYGDDAFESDASNASQSAPQSDKLKRILAELDNLKDGLTKAGVGAKPQSAPQTQSSDAALLDELNRLRAEQKRTQDEQNLARVREELLRDLNARSQGTQVYDEINRLTRRLDSIEQGNAYRAPAHDYYGASNASQEVSQHLAKIETLLSEMSVLLIAHDVTPIAKEVSALKEQIASLGDNAMDGYGDKVLDELVRLQTAIEDVRLMLEEDPDRDPFDEGTVIQDNLFDTQTLDKITQMQEAMHDGFARIDEQVTSILNDLHIYSSEGYDNGGLADALNGIRAHLDESLPKTQMLVEGLVGLREAIVAFSSQDGLNQKIDGIADSAAVTVDLLNELKLLATEPDSNVATVNTMALIAGKIDTIDERLSAIENAVSYIPMPIADEPMQEQCDGTDTPCATDAVMQKLDAIQACLDEQAQSASAVGQGMQEIRKADAKPALQAIADALRSLDDRLVAVEQTIAKPCEVAIDYATLRAALRDIIREELATKDKTE